MFSALWHLGDYYKELQDLKNWRKSWEKVLTLCEQVRRKYYFSDTHRNIPSVITILEISAKRKEIFLRQEDIMN